MGRAAEVCTLLVLGRGGGREGERGGFIGKG